MKIVRKILFVLASLLGILVLVVALFFRQEAYQLY
jgi:hypothetical protein